MDTSDQSPQDKLPQVSGPLYEFAGDESSPVFPAQALANSESQTFQPQSSLPESSSDLASADDLIRQGLIYPPPPSFYQRANPVLPAPPVLPVAPPAGSSISAPPPSFIPSAPLQPAAKKSYKWIWVSVSIVSILLLASCSICGWGVYKFFSSTIGQAVNAVPVANQYYAALADQDYSTAYQLLAPQGSIKGMTVQAFTQRAQSADENYGTVRSYTSTLGNLVVASDTQADFSRFTVIVDVSRMKQKYSVLLTLQKFGNGWKIVDFDKI